MLADDDKTEQPLRNGILLIAHESVDLLPVAKKITGNTQLLWPADQNGTSEFPWRVETKYYTADLVLACRKIRENDEIAADTEWIQVDRWDAVVWAFDPAQIEKTLKPLWALVNRIMPEHEWEPSITVALSLGATGSDEVGAISISGKLPDIERLDGDDGEADFGGDEDDSLDAWLARHGFELVQSETEDGWSRLIEALQAHMWDGFTPVLKNPNASGVERDAASESNDHDPRIKSICDMLARIEDEDDNFDLETMLKEIKSLRNHAQMLPAEKRHDLAEQIALSIADTLLPDNQ